MRYGLVLLLAVTCAAADPQLTSSDATPLAYDLAAEEPWMPLLWRDLSCVFSATRRIEISARLVNGSTGVAPDGTDLLTLRDGHRLHIDGTTLQVAGAAATWSGPVSGGGELTVASSGEIDASTAFLILRQICYANCGGSRLVAPRRVEVRLRAVGGTWSPALAVAIAPADADAPPLLRYDPQTLTTGTSIDMLPQGWYDGRTPLSEARWQLEAINGAAVTQNLGDGRTDAADAISLPLPWSAFTDRQLRLEAGRQTTTGSLRLRAFDTDGGSSLTTAPLTTIAPSERLVVVGDFPFAINAPTTLHFVSNLPNTVLLEVLPHPDGSRLGPAPTGITVSDGVSVILDPADSAAGSLLSGTVVFAAQDQQVLLPYRLVRLGTAQ